MSDDRSCKTCALAEFGRRSVDGPCGIYEVTSSDGEPRGTLLVGPKMQVSV